MIFFGELAVTVTARVHTGSNSNMQARGGWGGQEEAQQEESRCKSTPRIVYTLLDFPVRHAAGDGGLRYPVCRCPAVSTASWF